MRAEVKILVQGYSNADTVPESGEEKNCATITLVKDGKLVMVVDPGVLENQQILVDALANEGLKPKDINMVCLTHSHIDHYRNMGMFPNAKVLEYFGVWNKNTVHDWTEQFSENVRVLRTPGHSKTDITLFVTTKDGVTAICGDVFWRENFPLHPIDDPFAVDAEELLYSREKVLKMADIVIPGHGPMFKKNGASAGKEDPVAKRAKVAGKNGLICQKCHKPMKRRERCICRPRLCFRCCECGLDCDLCSCSHKKRNSK
ncbi:MAG: MBL fold metallo-hydrolase [Candidatus Staskawiczbacteria bacterium]|nr:MBL fold metallo-hydrolase [Candidatus Staskawiczbacteria bacterium]